MLQRLQYFPNRFLLLQPSLLDQHYRRLPRYISNNSLRTLLTTPPLSLSLFFFSYFLPPSQFTSLFIFLFTCSSLSSPLKSFIGCGKSFLFTKDPITPSVGIYNPTFGLLKQTRNSCSLAPGLWGETKELTTILKDQDRPDPSRPSLDITTHPHIPTVCTIITYFYTPSRPQRTCSSDYKAPRHRYLIKRDARHSEPFAY